MKLSNVYEPEQYERDITQLWEANQAFTPKPKAGQGSFSIVVPPPNANGDLHLGHGLTLAIEDILVRYHRLRGDASLLLPGADHAGFETQVVYEKQLAKIGKSRFDFSREELYQQIYEFVAHNKENYQNQFRQLGASVDWSRYVFTLDEKIVKQAYRTFKKMWEDGLVYRGTRLVNFCTHHGTAFSDIEVLHKEEPGHLWYIRYPLTDGSGEVVVATTRPETMLGDVAVAVHPTDKRFQKYIGKTVRLPLTERDIPVIADDMVDPKFGTGAVKITPAHDQNDFEVGQRHDLPQISVISHEGLMESVPEAYRGKTVDEARNLVLEHLNKANLVTKVEEIVHSVGHCYKCDTVIQPLLRDQWFISVKPLAKPAIKALKTGAITFYPDAKRRQLISYLEQLRDWNISRQIAWGIPIPAFQNVDDPDDWIFDDRVGESVLTIDGKTYHRDPDVFDTWFSSSSWPYATLDYPDGQDYNHFYPLSVMETAADILYPWVSRMIMLGLYETGEVPFKTVYLHGLILDEHGAKMSKSKGNVIDPMQKITQFGADAFRMGIIAGQTPGNNQPYDESKVVGARNFCNKLWNIARYVEATAGTAHQHRSTPQPKTIADHWILCKLQQTIEQVEKLLDGYRLAEAYDAIYHLVWDDFADWYLEASKTAVEGSTAMLTHCLEAILVAAHPFAPFVTETIWQTLPWQNNLLATSNWPTITGGNSQTAEQFEQIKALVTEVRSIKQTLELPQATVVIASKKASDGIYQDNQALIERLAKIKVTWAADAKQPETGISLTSLGGQGWLAVDQKTAQAFVHRLEAKAVVLKKTIDNIEQRLSNAGYRQKAPAHLVEASANQLKEAQDALKTVQAELKKYR